MKNILNTLLLIFCLYLFNLTPIQSQGWSKSFGGGHSETIVEDGRNDIIEFTTFKNGLCYGLYASPGLYTENPTLVKVVDEKFNAGGTGTLFRSTHINMDSIGHKPKGVLMQEADTLIYLTERYEAFNPENRAIYITKFYHDSIPFTEPTIAWSVPAFHDPNHEAISTDIKFVDGHDFITLGAVRSELLQNGDYVFDLVLVKISSMGNEIWSKVLNSPGNDLPLHIIPDPTGGFFILKNVEINAISNIWLMKTDDSGNLLWETNLSLNSPNDVAFDMVLTSNNTIVVSGNNASKDLLVFSVDANGNELWRNDYTQVGTSMEGRGIIEDAQQNIVVAGEVFYDSGENSVGFLAKLKADGTPSWERNIDYFLDEDRGFNDIVLTSAGDYLMGGYVESFFTPDTAGFRLNYTVKTDTFGLLFGGAIQGNIYQDLNLDCTNLNEQGLKNVLMKISNADNTYIARTDAIGNYKVAVYVPASGDNTYTIQPIMPSQYWNSCVDELTLTIDYLDTLVVDFGLQSQIDCAFLNTEMATNRFRICDTSIVSVNVCNNGTALADDASVDIELDDHLSFVSATILPTNINGQILSFDLGDIQALDCVNFKISAAVVCDEDVIGEAICLDAMVMPDSICPIPGQDWSGALLNLDLNCNEDSIIYKIKNVGANNMTDPLQYIIIEDAVLLLQMDFNLNAGDSILLDPLPINGAVYHLFSDQEPNAPGPNLLGLGANNCLNLNDSLYYQFPQYNGNPFSTTYCKEIVGPYDPNDKQASPKGFGEDHAILPNTDLQFTIRFQNTGTDTAFRVVIRDTISAHLDLGSLVAGPSSHPYELRLEDENHISFSFYNIALPDSTTNKAASEGFVSFRISQKKDLPEGTLIENTAGIYFDFNEPIITNTTFHTIKDLFNVVTGSVSLVKPETKLKIIPNPMQNGAWISLKGQDNPTGILTLKLYDGLGRLVKEVNGQGEQLWLNRANLNAGIYFFTLEKDGVLQASAKLMVL